MSFLIKLQASDLQFYLKKGLRHRYFAVSFVKFLRGAFLQNTSSGCSSPLVRRSLIFIVFLYKPYITILGDFIHYMLKGQGMIEESLGILLKLIFFPVLV